MNKKLLLACTLMAITGCLTRAPTNYELDRRSGLTPPGSPILNDLEASSFQLKQNSQSVSPVRLQPQLEKIWVYDQLLGTRVLKGTWMWIEIHKGGLVLSAAPTTTSIPAKSNGSAASTSEGLNSGGRNARKNF